MAEDNGTRNADGWGRVATRMNKPGTRPGPCGFSKEVL